MTIKCESVEVCSVCEQTVEVRLPIQPYVTTVTCPECHSQILLVGEPYSPVALDPRTLTGKERDAICSHGCHFTSPYGFVPMAGCPIHD